jgi:16S rRNA G966 N2-methylase RsmD
LALQKPPFAAAFKALPPFFGGKRALVAWIFQKLADLIPQTTWHQKTFLDAFAGGGSVSLFAKAHGFQSVLANDWSDRTQIILESLLSNQTQLLTEQDLLILTQPLPDGQVGFVERELASSVVSKRHANAIDRVRYWASQYQDPIKRNLGLVLLWHLIQLYVVMPTSINTSNRPYAETLDGLRDWQELNPKRFVDNSFPRLCQPRWAKLESLRTRINAGVFGGTPVQTTQLDAHAFVKAHSGDIVYFDPPYAGSLSYESSLRTLDALLFGRVVEETPIISPFSQGVDALTPLLEAAQHIPVWILSYSNHLLELEALNALVQQAAPERTVVGYERGYQHLAHVSKATHRKELLVIAYGGNR